MRIDVYPPDRRQRDLDNVQKCLIDAIDKGGAFAKNDSQIDALVTLRRPAIKGGRAVVHMIEINESWWDKAKRKLCALFT